MNQIPLLPGTCDACGGKGYHKAIIPPKPNRPYWRTKYFPCVTCKGSGFVQGVDKSTSQAKARDV